MYWLPGLIPMSVFQVLLTASVWRAMRWPAATAKTWTSVKWGTTARTTAPTPRARTPAPAKRVRTFQTNQFGLVFKAVFCSGEKRTLIKEWFLRHVMNVTYVDCFLYYFFCLFLQKLFFHFFRLWARRRWQNMSRPRRMPIRQWR